MHLKLHPLTCKSINSTCKSYQISEYSTCKILYKKTPKTNTNMSCIPFLLHRLGRECTLLLQTVQRLFLSEGASSYQEKDFNMGK